MSEETARGEAPVLAQHASGEAPPALLFRFDETPARAEGPNKHAVVDTTIDLSYLDALVEAVETRRYPGAFTSAEPTPYQQSEMCGSTIEHDNREDRDALHNARNPYYAIKFERFEHRVIAFLKAEGFSNKEIAERTGMSAVAISNIIRQPYIQQQILRIIHEKGGDAVQSLLEGAAADSVARLIEERDNERARPAERINAANAILDRLYGKPNQPIEHKTANLDELSDEELENIVLRGSRGRETATTASTGTSQPSGVGAA